MTAGAFVRKRPIYAPGPQVALDYLFEKRRQRKRGFVAMTVLELGKALGRCESAVQRWLSELTEAGEVLRIYNGGQGRRRACIFYVGKSAVARASEQFPVWDAKNQKAGDKPAFGPLRMGKVVLDQRTRKGRKNATLKPSASVESRGGVLSELPPLGEQPRAVDLVAESGTPPDPPAGGTASEETAPNRPAPPPSSSTHALNANLTAAQNRLRPSEPPNPPRGAKKAAKKGVGVEPAWLAIERRTLVCQAWGHWRTRYVRAHGRDYSEHAGDGKFMQRLVARALMKTRSDQIAARELLRWWFRQYMADPNPPSSPLGERHHPLFRLERITEEYGSPPLPQQPGAPAAASMKPDPIRVNPAQPCSTLVAPPAPAASSRRRPTQADRTIAEKIAEARRWHELAHDKVGLRRRMTAQDLEPKEPKKP